MHPADSRNVTAIVVAGGKGIRLKSELPKPFIPLKNRPLLSYSLQTFEQHPRISDIVLVCGAKWLDRAETIGRQWAPGKLFTVVSGGPERVDSVRSGLDNLPSNCTKVAVHDAARPFLTAKVIDRTLTALDSHHGAVPGISLVDTLRKQDEGVSLGAPDRSRYVLTQTPQCFQRHVLEEAFQRAEQDGFFGTDDASYVERMPGARVAVVEGDPDNFKITTPQDLNRAEAMMENGKYPEYRCGEGFDAHRFATGRKLILGGITIPFELGLHGHSDADILCHAIGDALLGSVSLGDLGEHFPDTDPAYQGVSSIELLKKIRDMVVSGGYSICNVDATIIVQLPKIAPHRQEIRASIAAALQLDIERVSIKATTTEGMGPFGRGEGIACRAVAMVVMK